MRCERLALAVFAVAAGGCVSIPDTYAPPMQRRALAGPDTSHLKHFVAMGDQYAPDHFLKDVNLSLEGGSWRWTGQAPTLRFVLKSTHNLRLVMDFSISGETMKQTGPVTITYWVNGKVLDKVHYDKPGEQHFEKAVPEEWLYKGDNIVTAELDKVYIAEADGVKLGFPLVRIGFVD
jgi:hypothetical protein